MQLDGVVTTHATVSLQVHTPGSDILLSYLVEFDTLSTVLHHMTTTAEDSRQI